MEDDKVTDSASRADLEFGALGSESATARALRRARQTWPAARLVKVRKLQHCDYAVAGGRVCRVPILPGDTYIAPDPENAGGLGGHRYCLKHFEKADRLKEYEVRYKVPGIFAPRMRVLRATNAEAIRRFVAAKYKAFDVYVQEVPFSLLKIQEVE